MDFKSISETEDFGSISCVSVATAPCPGKCLTQENILFFLHDSKKRAPILTISLGLSEKHLPSNTFESSLFKSKTGPRLKEI